MDKLRLIFVQVLCIAGTVAAAGAADEAKPPSSRILLNGPWALQSSCQVKSAGAAISAAGFKAEGWHRAEVPSTVVGALVADKTYPDPYFGMNLRSFPGVNYRIGAMFSNLSMPDDSPFRCSWWYRTEFAVPTSFKEKTLWLHFDGINYRANVWLNGRQLEDAEDIVGPFRAFEFDISKTLDGSTANALAVEVFAPEKDSLAITFVDWNPAPPDKDMGLWKDVYLTASGPVTLRHPFVTSKLGENYKTAELTASADVHNSSDHVVEGVLKADIGGIRLSEPVRLAPSETKKIRFESSRHPQLKLQNPNLWWPYQMGAQSLYTARLEFESRGRVSDVATVRFGIREVKSEMTSTGARLFRINGKKVLIRGAAWTPDMLLRWSAGKAEAELRYVKDMGLNTIRLEGKMERDEFFDMADRLGILIMPGWCCCDFWERWRQWRPEHHKIAGASLEHELRRLRNHPSVFVWLYGSDGPPPADVEKMYLDIIKDQEWPNPTISSAAADSTTVTGRSGVKMPGPYDYEPPNYWLVDKEAGGAFGFNTETSPGPAIPPLESLKRFLPADHLWPIDQVWTYHAGGERFMNLNVYLKGMEGRYGKAENLADFLRKSQAMAYEGQRAMFEAYARNKYTSTGVIQWMLDNAWPSLIWHLYDYYLVPAGGYFGTKKACEPVHVQYSYDDNSVAVVNGKYHPLAGLKVSAKIYALDGTEKYSHDATLEVPADTSIKAFELPPPDQWSTTYFLRLELHDAAEKLVSDNLYWLSTKPDTLDWKKRRGTAYTPQKDYGDLSALNQLPTVKLVVDERMQYDRSSVSVRVTVRNPEKAVAFMVRLRLTSGKGGEDIVPVFWDDNYVTLMPGEHRALTATYEVSALAGATPVVEVDGWNIGSVQR
jgi:exo-1,4-beta-D-glucosaminidase